MKPDCPGGFSFEQQNLVANFPLRYRGIVLAGRESAEGWSERGENHRETRCPVRPARTMGILYGHMLPKRGQLFMTPFRERPAVRWGHRLSIYQSVIGSRSSSSLGSATEGNETIFGESRKGERATPLLFLRGKLSVAIGTDKASLFSDPLPSFFFFLLESVRCDVFRTDVGFPSFRPEGISLALVEFSFSSNLKFSLTTRMGRLA